MILFIKGWFALLSNPLVVSGLLAIVGGFSRWRGQRRLGLWLVAFAAVVGYFGASPMLGDALIGPLERAYPPLQEGAHNPSVGYVVVLGAGYEPRDGVPVTAALNPAGLVRLVEAIRLMRVLGIEKLVLSGGAAPGLARSALGYAKLARDLGIPESSLIVLDEPQSTAAEARAVKDRLGDSSFILVTSAAHMPRAMRLMQRVGAHAVPAPTGQLVVDSSLVWTKLFPNSGGLRKVESALHEYIGLLVLSSGFN